MEELIEKYIKGIASAQECREVLEWAALSAENERELIQKKAAYSLSETQASYPSRESLKRMKESIHPKMKVQSVLLKVAAILVIPLIALSILQYYNYNRTISSLTEKASFVANLIPKQNDAFLNYTVNPGVKGLVTLPDGSNVWLNSNSTLKCPSRFDSTARVVELVGEGYFSVKSNSQWPMYVKTTRGITVKVVGTEFNLSSYTNDSDLRLTLVSGKVTMINEKTDKKYLVNPSEELIISDSPEQKPVKKIANVYQNTGWKDGKLIFDSTPMDIVIKKMERWYGVTISVADNNIFNERFSGEFQSESLSQVLEFIKYSSNIKYSVSSSKIVTLSYK